jgi:hypothetical protein
LEDNIKEDEWKAGAFYSREDDTGYRSSLIIGVSVSSAKPADFVPRNLVIF